MLNFHSLGVSLDTFIFRCIFNGMNFLTPLQELLFSSIQEGRYEFPEREWRYISEEAKSLIRQLLAKDAMMRPSAESILSHPWLADDHGTVTSPPIPTPVSSQTLPTPQIMRR